MIDAGERIKYLKSIMGDCESSRDGLNIAFSCPSCNSAKAKKKLVIKIDTGQWHCWVCEIKGGSVSSLLKKYYNKFYQEWLNKYERKEIRDRFLDDKIEEVERVELPEALNIDELVESSDPDAMAIVSYLEKRGIDIDIAYRYRVMGIINGRMKRRVLIPSFDGDGCLNYWTARSIDPDSKLRYVNPKVDRRSIIFNEVDVDWAKEIVIVEGPFDLLKAGDNAIALLGSTLSYESTLFKKIIENKTPVTLALDKDAILKSHKIAKSLYQYNINVKFIELDGDRDVGDMSPDEFQELKNSRAYEWSPMNRLFFKINSISSGSLL